MQVGIDVTYMCTNFGGHGLLGFGDIATFKNGQFSCLDHGHQKIESAQKIYGSRWVFGSSLFEVEILTWYSYEQKEMMMNNLVAQSLLQKITWYDNINSIEAKLIIMILH